MAKRRRPEQSDVADRVVWLLDHVWGSNRSRMAEAIGCTHSVLTKIAAGQQKPGRRVLDAIAAHPKVNPSWLMAGEGEPLLREANIDSTAGWPLPISQSLFEGGPDQNKFAFGGDSFPVAGAFYRPSRYWLRISGGSAIARSRQPVIADDLLLMESDPTWWPRAEAVDGRLCIARADPSAASRLELALASFEAESSEEPALLLIDNFTSLRDRIDSAQRKRKPPRNTDFWPNKRKVALADIVAVGLFLMRR